jgi:asparagine synthase (glutamine-hydrolysing)
MCGLTGFWQQGLTAAGMAETAASMADRIVHRGPDDSGVWLDEAAGMALAHRRLAIVDPSAAGHQPMLSASGRFVLAYNGEVYNHLELRDALGAAGAAPDWRGHSDTETLLSCIEAWGVETALRRSVGMFAFALWDRQARTLVLARDRAGEKPLYYGWQGDTFLFGSELKALRAHPDFNAAVDRGALALLLRHNYIPAPYSIHQGIFKLPPGTWLELRQGQRNVQPQAYWSLAEVAERGMTDPFSGSDTEAVDELSRLLRKAVAGQQVADVPLGALLSGGIDSSLVTALMQAQSSRPVRTFTIGFEEKAYDEAAHARMVAAHLGTDHTELLLSANEALGLIHRLPSMYDEPFADSSQLPTHLVMQLARKHVTVALSGDAGDEFFGGYNRYFLGPSTWRRIGWMPSPLRHALGKAMTAVPARTLNSVAGPLSKRLGIAQPGDKAHKLGRRLRQIGDIDDLYVSLVTEWPDAAGMVVDGHIPPNLLDARDRWPRLEDPVARMMALDGLTYMPDDILAKVDRASMAVSLETRAPYLDRDVMEFAWSLPMSMKLRDGKGKWILRQLLDRHVPRALVERPKMGFGIPLDQWLRGPLREWAGDLLAEDRLRREGYFRSEAITRTWRAHLRGEESSGYRLWSVLMFQAWLEHQRGAA